MQLIFSYPKESLKIKIKKFLSYKISVIFANIWETYYCLI